MKVIYNRANVYTCGLLRLMPGTNEVDTKVWEKVAGNPGVLSRMEMGAIVVIEEAKKPGRKPKEDKLNEELTDTEKTGDE